MREKIKQILESICPDIDFEHERKLVDDKILDSFSAIQAVSEIMDEFNIEIDADDMEPENMNSLDQITAMVERKVKAKK